MPALQDHPKPCPLVHAFVFDSVLPRSCEWSVHLAPCEFVSAFRLTSPRSLGTRYYLRPLSLQWWGFSTPDCLWFRTLLFWPLTSFSYEEPYSGFQLTYSLLAAPSSPPPFYYQSPLAFALAAETTFSGRSDPFPRQYSICVRPAPLLLWRSHPDQ